MPGKRRSAGSKALADLKRDLALGYRILGHYGLGRGLLAHLTARLPGRETFWTYQLGMSVEEVRVRDLVEARFDAEPLNPKHRVNPSMAIHGDVYRARPDVLCIVHHHGDHAVALGALGSNLVPFDRNAARWHGQIGVVTDFEAPAIRDQGGSMVAAIGSQGKALLLKHHGVLVTGPSIRDAVVATIELEHSCGVQVRAMAAGPLHVMPQAEIDDCKKFLASEAFSNGTWDYYCRVLARHGTDDIE